MATQRVSSFSMPPQAPAAGGTTSTYAVGPPQYVGSYSHQAPLETYAGGPVGSGAGMANYADSYGASAPAMGTAQAVQGMQGMPGLQGMQCNMNFAPAHFEAPPIRAQAFQVPMAQPAQQGSHQPLTAGLPTPESIMKQKEGYIQLLDEQLAQGQKILDQQCKQQTEYLHQQASAQKQQVEMQIKQQVQQQEMQVMAQYNADLMMVTQNAAHQKSALEQQAMQQIVAYQQKKSEEEILLKQQQLQKEHMDAQMKFAAEMQKLQQNQAIG